MKKCSTIFWMVMKICMSQAMIAVILCGISAAHDNYAQLLDKKVTIRLAGVSLETALHELQDVTDVKIFFSAETLETDGTESVSINVKDETLRYVLNKLLTPYNIKYKVDEKSNSIIVLRKDLDQSLNDAPKVGDDQEFTRSIQPTPLTIITGTITDGKARQPMAGVNIIVKGTSNGTTSDSNGNYSIGANDDGMLVFSFIGYATFETQVGGRTVIDVVMQEDIKSLNEVVVNAGYWDVKEREQTGNISKVTAEEIQKQPVGNPLAALEGRMSGVYIQQSSGVPGSSFNIQIRGKNSLRTDGNAPLYIVDGVPFTSTSLGSLFSNSIVNGGSPLNYLNPSDIESIEVLKDADATAVYGSRGANGVVLITTKTGKAGRTKVDVNFYSGFGKVSKTMDLLNTSQYLTMRKEAFTNDGLIPSGISASDLLEWDTTRYTNWQKELIGGTAHLTNAQLSVSGGSANTQFLLSGGYYRESTVFPGDFADQKFSSHFNLSHSSDNEKFKATIGSSVLFDKNGLLYQDLTSQAITLPPNAPGIYDSDGNLNWQNGFQNPYSSLLQKFKANATNLITDARLAYNILPGLQLKANFGYNLLFMKENVTYPSTSYNPSYGILQGSSTFTDREIGTWIAEPQAEYQTNLLKGKLTALVGATFQQTLQEGQTIYAYGFASDALLENIQAASGNFIISSDYSQYKYNAVFGRINYAYDDKYLINFTARRDGSSRFGANQQFANFGAVGVAWIFSEEPFLRNAAFLSFGKIRGSIGTAGNDQIGDYQYLDTYSPAPNSYQGKTGLFPTRLANPDYAWEMNHKVEAAVDLGFLKNRISLSVSFYKNQSSNQLVGYALSAVTGFTSVQYNLPATVQNTGWEIDISSINLRSQDFEWTSSLNLTVPRNKLLEYPGIENSAYANIYEVGKSLYIQKRFHYLGVDAETGEYQYQDTNENGIGTDYPADLQAIKQLSQNYYGGLNNSVRYKGLQVDIFFQFVDQTGKAYFTGFGPPGTISNQPALVMDRWQKTGDQASIQKFTTGSGPASTAYNVIANNGDNNIVDASFVRLKNLSISWNLPEKWVSKVKLSKSRLYIQGQNLLTFTDYVGLDPETQSYTSLPPLRMITAGVHITL